MVGLKDICDIITGAVERVKKIRDYAFVHFSQREDAIAAMNALNGKVKEFVVIDAAFKLHIM